MSEQTNSQPFDRLRTPQKPFFSGDLSKQLVTILVSLTVVLVALANWLQADAGLRFSEAIRDVQSYTIQAMGRKASGEIRAGYAYADAFRLWFESDSLALLAEERGDPDDARRYAAVRDGLAELSPLLGPPNFDPARPVLSPGEGLDAPDIAAFEADVYLVEVTALSERSANAYALYKAWLAKSNAYRTMLIILASTLLLYALSTTVDGRMRWLFVGVGALIASVIMVWIVIVVLAPVHSLPEEAISAYARGVGLAHQDDLEGAIEAFDQALGAAPNYANAYYSRGNVFYDLGDLNRAAADYEAALAAGRTDVSVAWNLGWTYYVLGRQEETIRMTRTALEAASSQAALHFNLGLAYLVAGELEAAQVAYAHGMALATGQVADAKAAGQEPPQSLWWYLGTAAVDLDNLLNCLYDQICEEAPPYETIAASNATKVATEDLRKRLKNLTVALEYSGHPPGDPVTADIGPFEFAMGVYDDEGKLADYTPLPSQGGRLRFGQIYEEESEHADLSIGRPGPDVTGEVFARFDYEGIQDGQLVVVKVYVDGKESPALRLVEEWSLGSQGEAALPLTPGRTFTLGPGNYKVEIYVDSFLVGQDGFTIE